MQEKTDGYLTTEAIDLDHLENKSKTCKWAAAFIMEMPVKSSFSHLQKNGININPVCLLISALTPLHYCTIYYTFLFQKKLFFNQLQTNLAAMSWFMKGMKDFDWISFIFYLF